MGENEILAGKTLEAVQTFFEMRREYLKKRKGLLPSLKRALGRGRQLYRELENEEGFFESHITFVQKAVGTEMNYDRARIGKLILMLKGAETKLYPRFSAPLVAISIIGISVMLYPHSMAGSLAGFITAGAGAVLAVMENNRVSEHREACRELAEALENLEYPEPDPLS